AQHAALRRRGRPERARHRRFGLCLSSRVPGRTPGIPGVTLCSAAALSPALSSHDQIAESKLRNSEKSRVSTRIIGATSRLAAISRQECILSIGLPTSTARIPRRAAEIGPMVLPQGLSLRELKCCGATSTARQAAAKAAMAGPSLAYDWLTLTLITGPAPNIGRCCLSCLSG